MNINISNDPLTGFSRRFKNIKFLRDEAEERIMIGGEVETLYQGSVYKTASFEFNATKNFMVDANGDVVEEGIMTEYDFYNQMAIQLIDPQIEGVVQKLDASNRFDV